MVSAEKSLRFRATMLMQRGREGLPSASMYGGTSCSTRLRPPVKLKLPIVRK